MAISPISGIESISIEGLAENNLLLNNPIWIEVRDSNSMNTIHPKFQVGFSNGFISTYTMYEGNAKFDLSPIIKMMMSEPDFGNVNKNLFQTDVTFLFYDDFQGYQIPFKNKNFIRGGRFMGTNNHLTVNSRLIPTDRLPVWDWLPTSIDILRNGYIETITDVSNEDTKKMMTEACNGVYLKFLNSLGGYSFWFFEEYDFITSGQGGGKIKNHGYSIPQNHFYQLGESVENILNVQTRATKEFYYLMRDLATSSEVALFQPNKVFANDFVFSEMDDWVKIENESNDFDYGSGDTIKDFDFSFKLPMTYSPKLL